MSNNPAMIYKNTSLLTGLLLLMITLMGWLLFLQHKDLNTAHKQQLQQIKQHNKTLTFETEKTAEEFRNTAIRKPHTKVLFRALVKIERLIKPIVELIDKEYLLLLDNKENRHLLTTPNNKNLLEIVEGLNGLNIEVDSILDRLNLYRNLGIRPENYKELMETLSPIYNNIQSTNSNYHINSISNEMKLQVLKNSLLRITEESGNYLISKIGVEICGFWRPSLVSSSSTTNITVGEDFKTEIFLVDRPITKSKVIMATINGKRYKVKDGVIKFTEKPRTSGRQEYKVEMEVLNAFTEKIDSYKKTFVYYVQSPCL